MFLGHFGLAFGARKASPAIPFGALFLACQFADLLWPTLSSPASSGSKSRRVPR
jgi:hypothetical protein